jgi:hypothetical protein
MDLVLAGRRLELGAIMKIQLLSKLQESGAVIVVIVIRRLRLIKEK